MVKLTRSHINISHLCLHFLSVPVESEQDPNKQATISPEHERPKV